MRVWEAAYSISAVFLGQYTRTSLPVTCASAAALLAGTYPLGLDIVRSLDISCVAMFLLFRHLNSTSRCPSAAV